MRPNRISLCPSQQRLLQARMPAFKEYSGYRIALYITFRWYLYLLYSFQRSAIIPARYVSAGRGHPALRGMFRFYPSVTPNLFTNLAIPYCAPTFGHSVLSPTSDWRILLQTTDDYPPFNPSSTFENPPYAPTFPSQPSFSPLTSSSPQPDWEDIIGALFPTPGRLLNDLPPFASERSSPVGAQGSSSGSGHQEFHPSSGDSQSAMCSGCHVLCHVFQLELATSQPTKPI